MLLVKHNISICNHCFVDEEKCIICMVILMKAKFHDKYKRVGLNISYYRKLCGLTQEQLAAKLQVNGCDITRSALAKIEVGQRHLYPDEIILLKKLLNTEYDDIFKI